jgi:single-strand DNA-binding protein
MSNFNLNKVILGGRISQDLELKQTQSGASTMTFSIAVNRKTSKEQEQQADFITCVAWRNTAEFIIRYFRKGSSICITGEILTRSWQDKDGNKRYATEVLVSEAFFVDGKGESQATPEAPTFAPTEAPKFEEISSDDDLPF